MNAPVGDAPASVAPPLDASASELTVMFRNFMLQVVLVAGAAVALLGLPETSWLARWVVFFKQDEVKPLIGLAASMIASGWLLMRALLKHRKFQVQSFFLPQRVSKSPARPSAAVVAGVEAATIQLDRGADDALRSRGGTR